MIKTLIFSATYNERDNIKELIEKINESNFDLDIFIIDDNSPDSTKEILEDLKKDNSNLRFLIREGKLGLDTAHKHAYNYAIKNGYRKLFRKRNAKPKN